MVSRVDPFSVMKVGFLVSVAMGIALVVMTGVMWALLSAMGVFDSINELAGQIIGDGSGETFDVLDPSTNETVETVTLAGTADVDDAVAAAAAAFPEWSRATPVERSTVLLKAAALLDERSALPAARGAAVVHLAAIAHRPAGSTGAAEFDRINRDLAVSCARRARAAARPVVVAHA